MNQSYARLGRVIAIACAAASITACATVTRGDSQAWSVQTVPSGAAVKTTIGNRCDATPCTFKIKRKAEFDVTLSKKGYKTTTAHVSHDLSSSGAMGFGGNILVGGIIGMGVDYATGSALDLKPNPLVVTLEAVGVASSAPLATAPILAASAPEAEPATTPTPASTPAPVESAPAAAAAAAAN